MGSSGNHDQILIELKNDLGKVKDDMDRYLEDILSIEEFWKVLLNFVNKWTSDSSLYISFLGESNFQSLNSLKINLRDRFSNYKKHRFIGDEEKSRNEEKYFGQIVGDLIYRFDEVLEDISVVKPKDTRQKKSDDFALDEADWTELIRAIKKKNCVPFIGVEASSPYISLSDLSKQWTEEYGYPFEDSSQLARVAHFISIDKGSVMFPKNTLISMLEELPIPSFSSEGDDKNTYSILSKLDLPLYITTNYDHFMEESLRQDNKEPVTDIFLWSEPIKRQAKNREIKSVLFDKGKKFIPTEKNPLVYHLNGDMNLPESLVLTETDYLDFVINLYRENETNLPSLIRTSLTTKSLLFIGYNFEEINFRVIFQGVLGIQGNDMRQISIAVQSPPRLTDDKQSKAMEYLKEYTKGLNVHIYFGSTIEFVKELEKRLNEFNTSKGGKK